MIRPAARRRPQPVDPIVEPPDAPAPALSAGWRRIALQVLSIGLLLAASYVLYREFRGLRPSDIAGAMGDWGWGRVLLAVGLSAASFSLMGFVEALGLRWVGARVPWRRAMSGAFIAVALGHSLGANLLVAGAVRTRLYARWGVTLRQVAGATLFQGLSFGFGLAALAGASLLLAVGHDAAVTRIAGPVADLLGAGLLTAVALYIAACAGLRRPVKVRGRSLSLPTPQVAVAQVALGSLDNAMAAGIIWVLLPPGAVGYLSFVGAFAISVVTGLVSAVPGGVGVFEGALSALLHTAPPAALAAAFLGYRLAFFILPLGIAALALAGLAITDRRRR